MSLADVRLHIPGTRRMMRVGPDDPALTEETPIVVAARNGELAVMFDATALADALGDLWPSVQSALEHTIPRYAVDEVRALEANGAILREAIAPLAEAEATLLDDPKDPLARAMIVLVAIQARVAQLASL